MDACSLKEKKNFTILKFISINIFYDRVSISERGNTWNHVTGTSWAAMRVRFVALETSDWTSK